MIIAIDPGLNGQLIVLKNKQVDMSVHLPIKGNEINTTVLLDVFQQAKKTGVDTVVVEIPQARGGQGNLIAIANWGEIRACAKLAGLKFETVHARAWCKHYQFKAKHKAAHIKKAMQLGYDVPKKSTYANSPHDDNWADALLIGLWYLDQKGT